MSDIQLICGDCLEVMAGMAENSVDTVITDPPAGISFMGKTWDSNRGGRDQWIAWLTSVMTECYRVLKPGGMALVWAIPRTSHWTGTAIENAGFIPKDIITHIFGSGFPKSANISKMLDKKAGAEREVVGVNANVAGRSDGGIWGDGIERPWKDRVRSGEYDNTSITAPATDLARTWEGYGTALKPPQNFGGWR